MSKPKTVRLTIEITDAEAGMIISLLRKSITTDRYSSASKKRNALIGRIWDARWLADRLTGEPYRLTGTHRHTEET